MIKFKPKDATEYIPLSIIWKKEFGLAKNIKYILLELIFSKQIIHLMSNTSSMAEEDKIGALGDLNAAYQGTIIGQVSRIEKFIPASLMTKIAEPQLVELLAIKFAGHYNFLILSDGTKYYPNNQADIDLTALDFRVNKDLSHQLTSYTGKIDFIFLSFETVSVATAWCLTQSLEFSLFAAGIFEISRRLRI